MLVRNCQFCGTSPCHNNRKTLPFFKSDAAVALHLLHKLGLAFMMSENQPHRLEFPMINMTRVSIIECLNSFKMQYLMIKMCIKTLNAHVTCTADLLHASQ